jgi:DNA polymerase III epsilon subunit-like protein
MKTYNSFVHLNGNLLAAMDYETTGGEAGYHEVIQVGIVPLNADLRPNPDLRPFYCNIAPKHPERAQHEASVVHGLDLAELMLNEPSSEKVADLLMDWFTALDLPIGKKIVPMAHNWAFEKSFSEAWLGHRLFKDIFHFHPRDSMTYALSLKDKAAFAGAPMPYRHVGLGALCKHFGIVNSKPHDALCDAIAEAEVYRALLHLDLF